MIRVEVNYGALKGGQRIPLRRVRVLLQATERALRHKDTRYVSVAFVPAPTIKRLNEAYYGGEGVTDVLAFPAQGQHEVHGSLGEILIYYAKAARQAGEHGVTPRQEVELLLVHGLLHLFGYDHDTPKKRQAMFALQDHILESARV